MSGYTKGTWEARGGMIVKQWYGEKVITIATVNDHPEHHEDRWCAAEEADANARLIAAAPDMAEALRTILSHPETCSCANLAQCDAEIDRAASEALQKAGVL